MAINDNESAESKEQVLDSPSRYLQECSACSTKVPSTEVIRLRCADRYCNVCLAKIFETAMKDEAMYPPSCHGMRIPTKLVQTRLSKSLLRRFREMQPELSTRNKTYCHRTTCSAFIAPHSIHNGQAICQKCRSVTCSKCRNAWHFGRCLEGDDAALFELMRSTNWKRCPECRRVVEKNDGCNHMV